jgi:hypothetical protein
MSQAIVNKLLHAPLVVLKQAASDPDTSNATIAIARKLFNLDKDLKKPDHGKAIEAASPEVSEPAPGKESTCR